MTFFIQILTNSSSAVVAVATMKFCTLFLLFLSWFFSLSSWLIWQVSHLDILFDGRRAVGNMQFMEVVFLSDHQAKVKAAVLCDLADVSVPLEV